MDVYWLQQTAADVPLDDSWLTVAETDYLRGLRIAKRRADWRLGRWTAKRAVAAGLGRPPNRWTEIEIRPAASGAPEIFLSDFTPAPFISLTHCNGIAVCALTRSPVAVGCDLEIVEPRSQAFLSDYFTGEEQELVAETPSASRPLLVSLLWSAKESALKALREGLRLDTRSVSVTLPAGFHVGEYPDGSPSSLVPWQPLHVTHVRDQVFQGWWRRTDDFVLTVVANPRPDVPIQLFSR